MSGLAAIIPAGGLSSRMEGAFKPLLPLRFGTVLSQCVSAFKGAGVESVIVVTGNRGNEVTAAAYAAGAEPVHNSEYEQGMFSTILAGVRALPEDIAGFFLLPVDMPLVRTATVNLLKSAYLKDKPRLLYPRFLGERGHPPVIGGSLIPDILAHDGKGGLRTVLDRFEADAVDLDVADFGTVHDIDQPGDYELARKLAGNGYPNDAECDQLWAMRDTPAHVTEHIKGHCRAVSAVAEAICRRLNGQNGACRFNPALVRGAALTHDVGKGTKRHEAAGAELLRAHGFAAAADIVADHFDCALAPDAPLTEKEIVFLADKLVRCHGPVELKGRYLEKIEQYRHEEGAEEAIRGRLDRALAVLERFDSELECSAEELAREALA